MPQRVLVQNKAGAFVSFNATTPPTPLSLPAASDALGWSNFTFVTSGGGRYKVSWHAFRHCFDGEDVLKFCRNTG